MRNAPTTVEPVPTGLAITIIIGLLIAVAGLWWFVFTGKIIAMWIGALRFVTSGAVGFAICATLVPEAAR